MIEPLSLYTVGFGRPDLLLEQGRLLAKYLLDPYEITLVDNTPDEKRFLMEAVCEKIGAKYERVPGETHEHHEALNLAAGLAEEKEFFGFLDHDVFPRRKTSVSVALEEVGFYGIGQRHAPTGHRYLWPGLCFFSRSWLNGRSLDFTGIRSKDARDNGDCGSGNWPLFTDEDWRNVFGMEHGYRALREPDSHGLQSWGYEIAGDWLHLTNSSHWMDVPDPGERDRLATEIVSGL